MFFVWKTKKCCNQRWYASGFSSGTIFSIYINDLSNNLDLNVKLFVDDTSMFFVVSEPATTSVKLNKG